MSTNINTIVVNDVSYAIEDVTARASVASLEEDKVTKETGKTLIEITELERLSNVHREVFSSSEPTIELSTDDQWVQEY